MSLAKELFVGHDSGRPFSYNSDTKFQYVFALNTETKAVQFLYGSGHREDVKSYSYAEVLQGAKDKIWKELSESEIRTLMPQALQQVAAQPAPIVAKAAKPAPFAISAGKLYFNVGTKQVERVVTVIDGKLIWTARHKQEAKPYGRSNFRKATDAEVTNYLQEAS